MPLNRKYIMMLLTLLVSAAAKGQDTIPASFFRDVYHHGDLVYYLEAHDDNTIYQGNHSGQWSTPDQLLFSVNGNPFHQNRYYIDGIRLDNRFQPGSTLYVPNMEHHSLSIDTRSAALRFTHDDIDAEYLLVQGNFGGLGGVSPGTASIIHAFHRAGWEGAYKPEVTWANRQYIREAFTTDIAFRNRTAKGTRSLHHIYATYGKRFLPKYDADGLIDDSPLYGSGYYKVQTDGHWTIKGNPLLNSAGYYFNVSGKGDYGSEHYYNWQETARLTTVSATAYAKRHTPRTASSLALTLSLNNIKHDDISFERNVIDQDGESFEPWTPDGTTIEASLHYDYTRNLLPGLKLYAECYESYLHFSPSTECFSNEVFCKLPDPIASHFPEGEFIPVHHERIPLYRWDWTTSSFGSALLENSAGARYERTIGRGLQLSTDLAFTLDGMLLGGGRSKLSPNFKASAALRYAPSRAFDASITLSHDRMRYTLYDINYFSRDYLNGKAYSAATGELFITSGGAYRDRQPGLGQTSYLSLEIPIHIRLGKQHRHEIALIQTYRKYYNVWSTAFDVDASQYGHYDDGIFFYNPGEKHYTVGYMPDGVMGNAFFSRTPFYLSQLTRYTYRGSKFLFSASWQSILLGSTAALANGPMTNDVGALSEINANPNTSLVGENDSPYAAAGRADQDKGFVLRILASYNISRMLQVGINAKWTDGQPFTNYHTPLYTDANGNSQVAIVPARSRGTNPIDNNFGSRENAIFNIDLHARLCWRFKGHNMSLTMMCYNIYDFGNSINEYCFNDGLNDHRADMLLNIPRGIVATYQIEL